MTTVHVDFYFQTTRKLHKPCR